MCGDDSDGNETDYYKRVNNGVKRRHYQQPPRRSGGGVRIGNFRVYLCTHIILLCTVVVW